MKAYIAGKITGDQNYFWKFEQAEKELQEEGFTVINPAVLPEGMMSSDYMRICLAMIDTADVAVFLPDWPLSRGAGLEFEYCQYIGKQTLYLGSMRAHKEGNHESV